MFRLRRSLFLLTLCFGLLIPAKACEIAVKHQLIESSNDKLVLSLLKLSLSKVPVDVCYAELSRDVSAARESHLVQKRLIDVHWASASSEIHQDTVPIRQPIFKGILGHRLLVIRKGEQHRFDEINSLSQLQHLVAGQGEFWGDTKVLQAAELPVFTSTRGRRLWDMLAQGRFDYLPLAVHEPWDELRIRPDHNLTVEQNLMLVYPMAMYFYVNHNDHKLHQLIDEGMTLAINDGSYDQRLLQSSIIKSTANYADIEKRRVIFINNPDQTMNQDFDSYQQQTQQLIELINGQKVIN